MKKITSIALLALAASTAHGKTIIQFACQFPFYSDEDGAKKNAKGNYVPNVYFDAGRRWIVVRNI